MAAFRRAHMARNAPHEHDFSLPHIFFSIAAPAGAAQSVALMRPISRELSPQEMLDGRRDCDTPCERSGARALDTRFRRRA